VDAKLHKVNETRRAAMTVGIFVGLCGPET
jgi:hypothetical protein